MKITDVYTPAQLIAIGTAAMDCMKAYGPDVYFHKMTNEDYWFDMCIDTFPETKDDLVDWVTETESKRLPDEILGELFYRAEQVVFGTSVAEYMARDRPELLFSGFCVIRQAMNRATLFLEAH